MKYSWIIRVGQSSVQNPSSDTSATDVYLLHHSTVPFPTTIKVFPSLIPSILTTTMLWSTLALMLCAWCFHRWLRPRLPGPILGSLSPIRHLILAWSGELHLDVLDLHRRHGNIFFSVVEQRKKGADYIEARLYGTHRRKCCSTRSPLANVSRTEQNPGRS